MSDYEDLTYELKGHVALITLNRPERLNALSEGMTRSIAQAFRDSQANDDVRVVVVTGAGRGFCSGADLRAPRGLAEGRDQPEGEVAKISQRRYNLRGIHASARAVQALDKPYIACVNGAAAGAGMDFASMADIRWAGRDAKFTTAFTRVGIVAGDGGGYYLPRVIGMARALELLWTSRLIDAEEALSMGYVTRVIDNDKLLDETLAFAERDRLTAADCRAIHQAAVLPEHEHGPRHVAAHVAVHADDRGTHRGRPRGPAGLPREAQACLQRPIAELEKGT